MWLQVGQIKIQHEQIKKQQNEAFEAGIFRIFEALKPELENLSVRIISKIFKAKLIPDSYDHFNIMLKKYHNKDRTVFLRAMQKDKYCNAIQSGYDDKTLDESISRFKKIMTLFDRSLNQIEKNDDDDFSKAIKATEIYETYRKCF